MKKLVVTLLVILVSAVPAFATLTPQQARNVWLEVAEPTKLSSLPFRCAESITPNAWVTSGKSVTVTTSLLEMLETEDELYGVLAHEAGHIMLKHHDKTVRQQIGKSILSSVISSVLGGISGYAANVGVSLASAGYSRQQEIEADDYAVKLAAENGRKPEGLYSALLKLAKHQKTEGSGFNSHPPDDRRLLHIRNTINLFAHGTVTSNKTFEAHMRRAEETGNKQNSTEKTEKDNLNEYMKQLQNEFKQQQ